MLNFCTCGVPTSLDHSISIAKITISTVFALLFTGLGLAWFVHPQFHAQTLAFFIKKALIVTSADSVAFEFWSEVPRTVDIYFSAYLFNVTNADAVVKVGAKPELQQVGPFVYTVVTRKTHINFKRNFTTATYYNNVTLTFNPEVTKQRNPNTSLNTKITVPNIPLIVIDQLMDNFPKIKYFISPVLSLLHENDIFIQKTVNETLWGYEDPALERISSIPLVTRVTGPIDPMIGLLRGQNQSTLPGLIEIDLGVDNYMRAQQIITINGTNKLDYWESDYANAIVGSDGQQQHPMIQRSENLTSYSTDLKRSIWLTYDHDRTLHGVNLYRYKMAPEILQTAENYPQNQGFCTGGRCPPYDGALNISTTMPMNVPIFISNPHFCDADPRYREMVGGMVPNATIHQTFADMEPITGFVMSLARRMQYNIYLKRSTMVDSMKKLPKATFQPIIWYSIEAEMGRYDAMKWKSTIGILKFLYLHGIAIMMAGGIIMFVCMAIRAGLRSHNYYVMQYGDHDDLDPLLAESAIIDANTEARRQQNTARTDHVLDEDPIIDEEDVSEHELDTPNDT